MMCCFFPALSSSSCAKVGVAAMKINVVFVLACLCTCVCVRSSCWRLRRVCEQDNQNKSKLISFAVTHGVCGIFIIHVSQRSQMDTCVSLACCLWTCLLTPPVVPQSKEHKVNNLEAADERATDANAQHAAHISWGRRGSYKRHLQGIFSTALTQQLIPIVETILLIQSKTLATIAYA